MLGGAAAEGCDGCADEYLIYVHPLVLGKGKRVFPEDAKTRLRLVDTKTFETGVVLLTYQPER